ncbi:MAG: phage portal protein [Bacilli bacterium]|nr:phage portal protein [Bacilli bacterium]
MELRSMFKRLFGREKEESERQYEELRLLDDNKAVFTTYHGDLEYDPDVLTCVDAIARNGAKMHPKHIRNFKDKDGNLKLDNLKGRTYRLLAKQPNEFQNAYQFYYQLLATLETYNDAFAYVKRDKEYKVEAIYPLIYDEGKYYEYNDKLYLKFKFGRMKSKYVPLEECIHLTRFVGTNGLTGGSSRPIIKTLSMKHILDEGIINAIKTTSSIKGLLKSTKALLKPEDVKKMRDQFVDDFINKHNKSGIGGLDATTDFIPVKIEPATASDGQIKEIDNKVLSYFGLNENILQSKYSEDEWNAFYESVLEPIGLQMSLEFTNKLFTPYERFNGNEIIFESNRLQYASNKTKVELIRYASNILTINEQREVFNLAPIENGDQFLIDQNHTLNEGVGGEENEGEGN